MSPAAPAAWSTRGDVSQLRNLASVKSKLALRWDWCLRPSQTTCSFVLLFPPWSLLKGGQTQTCLSQPLTQCLRTEEERPPGRCHWQRWDRQSLYRTVSCWKACGRELCSPCWGLMDGLTSGCSWQGLWRPLQASVESLNSPSFKESLTLAINVCHVQSQSLSNEYILSFLPCPCPYLSWEFYDRYRVFRGVSGYLTEFCLYAF